MPLRVCSLLCNAQRVAGKKWEVPDVDSAKLYLRQIGLELMFLRELFVGFILYLF